jgi:hypothetical protein
MNSPKTLGDGKQKNAQGADSLKDLAIEKDKMYRLDPGTDQSALNAERAKREGWSRTDWKGWPLPSATTHD